MRAPSKSVDFEVIAQRYREDAEFSVSLELSVRGEIIPSNSVNLHRKEAALAN